MMPEPGLLAGGPRGGGPRISLMRARASVLMAALLLTLPLQTHDAGAKVPEARSVFHITSLDGNLSELVVSLEPGATNDSAALTFPSNAEVVSASLALTPLPFTDGGTDFPLGPELDIGADGSIEWAYKGLGYGALGHQTLFHDGSAASEGYNLSFGPGQNRVLLTRLPANASITGASMVVGGWPTPFWGDPVSVTPPTFSEKEATPFLLAAGDRLWCAWATKDPQISDGTDSDIVVSWSLDGLSWSEPEEISQRGDILEDDSPSIIEYGGRIYVAWSAAKSESVFSPSIVYIRCWDGSGWRRAERLTPPELLYMNDWPQMAVYRDRLFVFWRTTDPRLASIHDTDDMDIVYRVHDGSDWTGTFELTPGWSTEIDWSLNTVLYRDRLYVFWDMDVDATSGFTVDIFYRFFDGFRWSDAYNIIPQPDRELDEIPKSCVYHNPATGMDELWVAWVRGSPNLHDLDIMVRGYDGERWGPMIELTPPGEEKDNMGQELLEYDGRLYVVWVTGTNTSVETNETMNVYNTYGDVIIRAYDGYGWSERMELTPGEENDNANSPTIAVFRDRLYVGWAYPYKAPPGGRESWDIIVRKIDFRPVVLEVDTGNDGTTDWGPSELQSTNELVPMFSEDIMGALAAQERWRDDWGNELCDVGIRLRSVYPSTVLVGNLSIRYSLTVRFENISAVLNSILRERGGQGRSEGNVTIPLRLAAHSYGKLRIQDINITYIINLPPVLLEPIPDFRFPEDTDLIGAIDLEDYFWDDWDDGSLAFELIYEENERGVDAVLEGSVLSFYTPTENWFGSARIQVRALDRARLWVDGNLINVTVEPVNDPPVLEPIPDVVSYVGKVVFIGLRATDVEGDPLSFSADTELFAIQPVPGERDSAFVRFVPRSPGVFKVNFSVSDGNGGSDSQEVGFRIRDRVSAGATELCPSWLVMVLVATGAVALAEWYRRRLLKETGPVVPPEEEFPEEAVFSGRIRTVRREEAEGEKEGPEREEDGSSRGPPDDELVEVLDGAPGGRSGDGAAEAPERPREEGLGADDFLVWDGDGWRRPEG
ncbi:MAG: hypothetical protein QXH42_09805 [Thermoplasmata archaeon]